MTTTTDDTDEDAIIQILILSCFMWILYIVDILFEKYIPSIVLEICVGCVLGPAIFNIFNNDIIVMIKLLGQLGLIFLVVEGGLHLNIDSLKKVGIKAFIIGFIGTLLPLLLCILILPTINNDIFDLNESIILGTALGSTAIGMIAQLMLKMNLLNHYLGQLICAAAMIDDIISLILLGILSNQSTDDYLYSTIIPLLSSVLYILVAYFILSRYLPILLKGFKIQYIRKRKTQQLMMITTTTTTTKLSEGKKQEKMDNITFEEEIIKGEWYIILLTCLFFLITILVTVTHYSYTTFLLGAFLAGFSFASIPGSLESWELHMNVISLWTSKFFFASMGFYIPVNTLFRKNSILYGILLTFIAIVSKLILGIVDYDNTMFNKFAIGWAMVGRGEIGIMMAQSAYKDNLLSEIGFSAVCLAILLATAISPIMFKLFVKPLQKQIKEEEDEKQNEKQKENDVVEFADNDNILENNAIIVKHEKKIVEANL